MMAGYTGLVKVNVKNILAAVLLIIMDSIQYNENHE